MGPVFAGPAGSVLGGLIVGVAAGGIGVVLAGMLPGGLPFGAVAAVGVLEVGNGVTLGVSLVSAGGDVARGGGQGNRALADNVRNCASASSRELAGSTP